MNDHIHASAILSLPRNVSESDALCEFRSKRLSSVLWRLGHGSLQRVAPLYLPFALYRLQYELDRTCHTRYVAIDQVEGTLDLFEFPELLTLEDLCEVETRNKIAPTLSSERSESLLREKVLRLVFQQGFFRMRRPQLELQCLVRQFHIPYWLGFYGKDGMLRCRVLDAVRRRMEGPKATLLFERWLAN
jgi:hypothetical protein